MAFLIVSSDDGPRFMATYELDLRARAGCQVLGVLKGNYPSLTTLPIGKKYVVCFRDYLEKNIKIAEQKVSFFRRQLDDLNDELRGVCE